MSGRCQTNPKDLPRFLGTLPQRMDEHRIAVSGREFPLDLAPAAETRFCHCRLCDDSQAGRHVAHVSGIVCRDGDNSRSSEDLA